jgi:uncharacterized ferritin-like protein (DUF455 family)
MNVTEFAERVVFGSTLEEKLLDPGQLTSAIATPSSRLVDSIASPGRPAGLQMQHRAGLVPPSDAKLENEQERGRLLHFLANHELLATELMALVLLKFPNAPLKFRQGVLVTLREEQAHTRLYLERMKECGVEFGEHPVSGHFWRVVEPMQSPMDFVSRLSLTFEQANLDYSRHFANVFQRIGDNETAQVLDRIYQDEIGHVRHGLHWFRQWKKPEQSDWEAYQAQLEFPMSPARARGPKGEFNRAGRLEAGLSNDFIDTIEVFRQSRGRPPTVRWFDSAIETDLGQRLNDRERQLTDQLSGDLEGLLVPMSKQDDVLVVRRVPSREFRKQLLAAGFDLPEFVKREALADLSRRKLHNLEPWAWNPTNHTFAQPLLTALREPPPAWHARQLDLYRKSWSAGRLRAWLQESPPDAFVAADDAGHHADSVKQAQRLLLDLHHAGHSHAIVKQDLATSGRGQRRLPTGTPLGKEDERWLEQATALAAGVVVEAELDRVLDLSFLWQFGADAAEPSFIGWTRPLVTRGRKYAGTRLGRPIADWDKSITRFLLSDRAAQVHQVRDWLSERIGPELQQRGFRGHFGIDALVCRDTSGRLKIKPLVELNPRMTMGHIALALEKRVAPGTTAELRLLTRKEWTTHHASLSDHRLETIPDGRWKAGTVWLGEADEQSKLIPVVVIGEALLSKLPPFQPAAP